jgi:serine/threonine protein kinase
VTTAADIYALGVLLYVLLGGQHPAGPTTRSHAELVKTIVETPAPRLSEAVASSARRAAGYARGHAARRAATPEKLGRLLRGDLDNIVAKALKKSPAERYATVAAFADDLRRHLSHQPVSARARHAGLPLRQVRSAQPRQPSAPACSRSRRSASAWRCALAGERGAAPARPGPGPARPQRRR